MFAIMLVLGSLLLASALLVNLLWHQRNARFLERELTERKAHEQEVERMSRLYAALSQVNQAVVRAGSRGELLRQICRALVQFGGFQMAWVGWVDRRTRRVLPLAQCGDDGYLQRVEVFADDRPEGRGPVGTAIREGSPSICNDVLGDIKMLPWREAAVRSGWHSLAAFPIRLEGNVRGALAVYARQQNFFGAQEQALIAEAATDVSFGLDTLLNDQRRKRAEESLRQARDALAQANMDLERKITERTTQLAEANANLQTFAYTAAHDLRSPLRGILSFSGIALEEYGPKFDEMGRSILERINQSAGQMSRLLDDLLEYSKISAAELKLERVNLSTAVSEALALLDADIRARNAIVTVNGPLPHVIGHPATLVLLVNNLVSNALKFMPPAVQPQIRIWADEKVVSERISESMSEKTSAEPSLTDSLTHSLTDSLTGSRVRIWVEDNGIGIESAHLGKIFGAFQRLHSKQAYPGTGLGLAIVRKGAERMGGQVGVESKEGIGSRFWLEFNAAD
jgi:signal transduction histidine kinase